MPVSTEASSPIRDLQMVQAVAVLWEGAATRFEVAAEAMPVTASFLCRAGVAAAAAAAAHWAGIHHFPTSAASAVSNRFMVSVAVFSRQ